MVLRVSRATRERLELEPDAIGVGGSLALPSARSARRVAEEIRRVFGVEDVTAGQLAVLSRLEEVYRAKITAFQKRHPRLFERAAVKLEARIQERLDLVLGRFDDEYLESKDDDLDNEPSAASADAARAVESRRSQLLSELFIFSLLDDNPAASSLVSALHGDQFRADPGYRRVIVELRSFLASESEELLEDVERPARTEPESLDGQLRLVLDLWDDLERDLQNSLLSSLDLVAEENKPSFPPGPGPVELPTFDAFEEHDEGEHYSPDLDWMPRLVLMAKSAFVWLDQLSRRYGRAIERLDQIPDEELARLAGWGFSGLWLIGLWERSSASRRIKQLMGNADGAASAYSLFDYRIAADLGGEEALLELRERAASHGIRLAADMVPNHMGIDSRWIVEHPERFVSTEHAPFPSYTFEGPDLCEHPDVGVFLEDHYYDRSDAAVVFKRVDLRTGDVRFIYHGNDGTSTPWNDTAQLDYLNPDTREAVIRTILGVARLFPVIRFDAAMTLAKKHYQRLWHPQPGTGGAIPSRAEHGLPTEAFAAHMPREFWREVVERIADEAPDTLLLAEAFWLMEGYFVRSLGMHRVYNSAFMNLLRDGDNAKYLNMVRETLAFDPQILKRYVNFLSNPDERTAVDQFGSEDHYFGTCTVMATLPGLPMFAHGQIEGLTEKYGMEFRRPQLDEQPDPALVERHQREIFPLLRHRELFAGVEHFELLEFVDADGRPQEDVLAFLNGAGTQRTLVLFNNRFARAEGRVSHSNVRSVAEGSERRTEPGAPLAHLLELDTGDDTYVCFRDALSELEYLRSSRQIHDGGLRISLDAYKYRVFTGFRQVRDLDGSYARLHSHLEDRGIPSLDTALGGLEAFPLRAALGEILGLLLDDSTTTPGLTPGDVEPVTVALEPLALDGNLDEEWVVSVVDSLAAIEAMPALLAHLASDAETVGASDLIDWLSQPAVGPSLRAAALLAAVRSELPSNLANVATDGLLSRALRSRGESAARADRLAALVVLALADGWTEATEPPDRTAQLELLDHWSTDREWRRLVGYNQYDGAGWLRKEDLEETLAWRAAFAVLSWFPHNDPEAGTAMRGWLTAMEEVGRSAERTGYRADATERGHRPGETEAPE